MVQVSHRSGGGGAVRAHGWAGLKCRGSDSKPGGKPPSLRVSKPLSIDPVSTVSLLLKGPPALVRPFSTGGGLRHLFVAHMADAREA